MTRTTNI